MEASKLIVALCEMDEDLNKFVVTNDNKDSLIRYMADFTVGYKLVCGILDNNQPYLLVDMPLNGAVADMLFEHNDTENYSRWYAYSIDKELIL